jgi:lipoyl(octanoyl) transferase
VYSKNDMNTIQNKVVEFEDLGTREYQSAWDYQESLMKNIIDLKIKNRDLPAEQHSETPNHFLRGTSSCVYAGKKRT